MASLSERKPGTAIKTCSWAPVSIFTALPSTAAILNTWVKTHTWLPSWWRLTSKGYNVTGWRLASNISPSTTRKKTGGTSMWKSATGHSTNYTCPLSRLPFNKAVPGRSWAPTISTRDNTVATTNGCSTASLNKTGGSTGWWSPIGAASTIRKKPRSMALI